MAFLRLKKCGTGREYWVVYWRDPEGKQRSRNVPDEVTGKELVARLDRAGTGKLAARRKEAGLEDVFLSSIGLEETLVRWVEDRAVSSEATARSYLSIARKFLAHVGDVPLSSVTTNDVQTFRERRAGVVERNTLRNNLKVLGAFFAWCVRIGLMEKNPADGVDVPRLRRGLPKWIDEATTARMLRELAADPQAEPDWHLVALLAVRQGLRRGEVLGLRWDDIHLDQNLIEIRVTKSKDPRRLPLHPEVREALSARPRDGANVFAARYAVHRGTGASSAITRGLNGWLRRNGYSVVLHGLRHSWATQLALRGASALQLREWLGHSDLDTTLLYVQAASRDSGALVMQLGTGPEAGKPAPEAAPALAAALG
jgi:integrase/recombinase XerD